MSVSGRRRPNRYYRQKVLAGTNPVATTILEEYMYHKEKVWENATITGKFIRRGLFRSIYYLSLKFHNIGLNGKDPYHDMPVRTYAEYCEANVGDEIKIGFYVNERGRLEPAV